MTAKRHKTKRSTASQDVVGRDRVLVQIWKELHNLSKINHSLIRELNKTSKSIDLLQRRVFTLETSGDSE